MAEPRKTDPQQKPQQNPGTIRDQADPHKKKRTDKVDLENKAAPTKPQQVQGANVNRPGSRG